MVKFSFCSKYSPSLLSCDLKIPTESPRGNALKLRQNVGVCFLTAMNFVIPGSSSPMTNHAQTYSKNEKLSLKISCSLRLGKRTSKTAVIHIARESTITTPSGIWRSNESWAIGGRLFRLAPRFHSNPSPQTSENSGCFPLCQTDRSEISGNTRGKWNIFRLNRANQ